MALDYDLKITRGTTAIEHNGMSPWEGGYVRQPLDFRRGRNYGAQKLGRSQAGRMTVTLYNDNGEWNHIKVRDAIQVTTTRNGDEQPQWTGFVDDIDGKRISPGREVLLLRCLGNLALLTRNTITEPPRFNYNIRDAMTLVLQRGGIAPENIGTIDNTVTMANWWAQAIEPLDAAFELEITSKGFLKEARNGQIELESFRSRVNQSGGKTFSNHWKFNIDSAQQRLNVAFEGQVRYLATTAEEVLWAIDINSPFLPLIVSPGTTQTIQAVIPNQAAQTGILAVNTISEFESQDYLATGSLNISAAKNADGILFTIMNPHAYDTTLIQLQVRGTALVEANGTLQRKSSEPPTINTEYTALPAHFLNTPGQMEAMFDFLISLGATGQTLVTLKWYADDDEELAHSLDLSDRMNMPAGFPATFFVERLHHRLWRGGRHEIRMTLSTTTPYDQLFVLGRSRLGSSAKLA